MEPDNITSDTEDCLCGDPKSAHQGQMGFGPCIINCCNCNDYSPAPRSTVATLREPSEKEIARGDVVSVAFIQCRIDYLLQQHELCGCVGLVDTCDECKKRDFAIRELQACL